ncbi:hypothetical protein LX36DRAFT_406969 [Colletotrichum falcatum]|nr:hypothetical protein LX36DRAFT_406969 [Colletotrichum falcatum]
MPTHPCREALNGCNNAIIDAGLSTGLPRMVLVILFFAPGPRCSSYAARPIGYLDFSAHTISARACGHDPISMSSRKDHGSKQHGLSDDAVEAGHDLIHEAEVEEERRHGGDSKSMPSMGSQQKKGVNLEGRQPDKQTGQEKQGKRT